MSKKNNATEAMAVRNKQMDVTERFIREQSIPKTETVLVCGDMNIDYLLIDDSKEKDEYLLMLKKLKARDYLHSDLIFWEGKNANKNDKVDLSKIPTDVWTEATQKRRIEFSENEYAYNYVNIINICLRVDMWNFYFFR